jgi:hypothetical protein
MADNSNTLNWGRLGGTTTLPNEGLGQLGSLTQQARLKSLNAARAVFLVVGLLTIGVNVIGLSQAEKIVNADMNQQYEAMRKKGVRFEARQFHELRVSTIQTAKVLSVGLIGVGVLYLVFAATVTAYPVAITISGLAIYVAAMAVFAVLDPTQVALGIIFKIFVIIGLVKAVQAAIAYEREQRESELANLEAY